MRSCNSNYITHVFFVTDVPLTSLRMGMRLIPTSIKEGSDVFFECTIRANPPAHKMIFLHNVSTATYIIHCSAGKRVFSILCQPITLV